MNDPHAASAAARARLDHQRKADALRLDGEARSALIFAVIAGRGRDPRLDHTQLGCALVAHRAHRPRRRPDEDEPGVQAHLREVGVLREKAVTGMDRLSASGPRGGDHVGGRQLGLRGRWRTDSHGRVGEAHMERVRVGVAIDGDRAAALGMRGADDTARDLAAIGDQDGPEPRTHDLRSAQFGARFSMKAATPSRPSGPRRQLTKLRAASSI